MEHEGSSEHGQQAADGVGGCADNGAGENGIVRLAEALEKNTTLTTVDLSGEWRACSASFWLENIKIFKISQSFQDCTKTGSNRLQ